MDRQVDEWDRYTVYNMLFLQHSDALGSIFRSLGLVKAFSSQLRPDVFLTPQ